MRSNFESSEAVPIFTAPLNANYVRIGIALTPQTVKHQFLLKSISGLQSVTSTLSETHQAPACFGPAGGGARFKVCQ